MLKCSGFVFCGHSVYHIIYIRQRRRYMFSPARLRSFVCLSVCLCTRLLKTRACIWMKCCVSTDIGTWTNWLTFEPDPDHRPNPDAGTGLLSPIAYALQGIILLRRGNPTYWYRAPIEAATRGFERRKTVVGGKCALSSALLVALMLKQHCPWVIWESGSGFCHSCLNLLTL